jgi:hypothetical protein
MEVAGLDAVTKRATGEQTRLVVSHITLSVLLLLMAIHGENKKVS